MPDTITLKLEKIINFIIKATIFLLPLFFLPWSDEYFEFNKQFLLWLGAPLAALTWLYQAVRAGQLKIKTNPLNSPVLIFLFFTAAAGFFSLDRFSSFFGHFGRFSDSWLGLFSLVIFYFLIINTRMADSAEKIIGLIKLLLYSSFIAAVISLAAMLGWLAVLSGEPLSIFSSAAFNPAGGSLLSLAIFLAVMSVMAAGFLFMPPPNLTGGSSRGLKKFDRIFLSAGLTIILFVLVLIDFSLSWALVLAGAGLMIFFRCLGPGLKKTINYYLLFPAALILLAVLMLAWPNLNLAKIFLGRELPQEAVLEYGQSWTIVKQAFKKSPALGSGPGTFAEDFSLFRSAEFNSGAFWQIRFDKSRSQVLEILATAGLLTLLSYFLIICLVFYLNIILLKKYLANRAALGADEDYNLIALLFIFFILTFCAQLGFIINTVLNFIFWFGLALMISFWQRKNQVLFKEKIVNLNQTVLFYRLSVLTLFILSAGVFTLLALEVKFFAADLIAAATPNREDRLITAVKLNPYRFNYRLNLAKLYLNQARAEALKPAGQEKNLKIQSNIARAIETATPALALAPNSVLPPEILGMIYRDIRQLTLRSEPWAVRYFGQALALEPSNPVLATELAKAYLNNNESVKAEEYFRRALELKGDYDEAKLGLAQTYLKEKKDNQALILLNELAAEVKTAAVYYELGRFYYNHGEIDKAMDRFKLVLSLWPRHANSLYSLALAYEVKGDFKEALKYYGQVLELNPGNKEVIKKIKETK